MALIDNIDGAAKIEKDLSDVNQFLGRSDISKIGNGTVTGALCEVNEKIENAIVQTTSPTLANSVAGGLKVVEIQGNSAQETTTGAQLFDIDNAAINTDYFDSNGSTLTGNTSTKVLLVEASANTAYAVEVLANTNAANTFKINCLTSGKAFINRVADVANGSATFTTPSNCAFLQIIMPTSITKVMLNEGTSALAWEKYTGAKASPNPDYPQEIKCVTSKNQLDCRDLKEQTINGVKFTPVFDSNGNLLYVNAAGSASEHAFYTLATAKKLYEQNCILSGCPSGGSTSSFSLRICESSNPSKYSEDIGSGITCEGYNTYTCQLMVRKGYTANNVKFYPMIRTSGDNSYVPHGVFNIKTHNKNFVRNCIYGTNIASNYGGLIRQVDLCSIEIGKTYTMSVDLTAPTNTIAYWNTSCGLIENPVYFNVKAGTNRYSHTFVAKNNYSNYFGAWLSKQGTNDGVAITASNFQVEENNVATDCELHQESKISLSVFKLSGIGDAKDRIINQAGAWNIERVWVEYTIPNNITVTLYDDVDGISRFRINASPKEITDDTNILSEYFSSGYTLTQINNSALPYKTCIYAKELWFTTKRGEFTAAEFKEFIAGKKIFYTLAESACEVLSSADQIALNSLQTFDGATHVIADCEIDPIFEVEYGTSKAGAYSLEAYNTAQRNSILINEINKEISNAITIANRNNTMIDEINAAIPYSITIDDAASTINFADR